MENQSTANPSETTPINSAPIIQPSVPLQMKTSLVIPILLTILVSAVIFGVGGYYFGLQSSSSQVNVKKDLVQPSPIITSKEIIPITTATTIPESNFKKYSNQTLGLSFQYPKDFSVQNDTLSKIANEGSLESTIQTNKSSYSFDQFVLYVAKSNDPLAKYVKDFGDNQNNLVPVIKTVGTLSITEWIGSYKNAPAFYYSFSKNGYIYNFGLVAPEDITKFVPSNENLLDQIVSTISFQ